MTQLIPDIGSFLGILIGSGIVGVWLRGRSVKVAELSRDITDLRDREVRGLATKLDQHVDQDDSKTAKAERRQILNKLDKIGDKVDLTREDVAELKAQREADLGYTKAVDNSLREHKRDGH